MVFIRRNSAPGAVHARAFVINSIDVAGCSDFVALPIPPTASMAGLLARVASRLLALRGWRSSALPAAAGAVRDRVDPAHVERDFPTAGRSALRNL